jgi:hypothetical protein
MLLASVLERSLTPLDRCPFELPAAEEAGARRDLTVQPRLVGEPHLLGGLLRHRISCHHVLVGPVSGCFGSSQSQRRWHERHSQ